jgi:hypothetical protein
MGAAWREGLDWQQVASALILMGVKRRQWPGIFNGLRAMQAAALEEFSKAA